VRRFGSPADDRERRRQQARRRYDALETARKQRRENTKGMLRGLPLPIPTAATSNEGGLARRDRAPVPRPHRALVLTFVVITAVVLITPFLLRAPVPPRLSTSCTTPGLALSSPVVKTQAVVRYSVTGPAESTYAVAVDATRLDPPPVGSAFPVAVGGRLLATTPRLRACKGADRFRAALTPGEHRVVLFRDGLPAATQPLTVR
jgi:hypothetical protein